MKGKGSGAYYLNVAFEGGAYKETKFPLVHLLQKHPSAAFDVLELRHGLEDISAYLAGMRANDFDRKQITQRFADLTIADRKSDDHRKGANADLEFHLAVAEASHNVALMHVMHGLMNLIRTSTMQFRHHIFALATAIRRGTATR